MISGAAHPSFAEIEYDATSPVLTVATYTYTDEDRNPADTITWSLIGTDAPHFNIGSASGVLSFSIRPDFENPFNAAPTTSMRSSWRRMTARAASEPPPSS